MNPYDLISLETTAGTLKFKLYSPIAELQVPALQTIVSIGSKKESADITVGSTELEHIALRVREDYSEYSQGFWYKVLQQETWLRIYLNENGTDKFFFFGTMKPDSVTFDEVYVSDTVVRIGTITLVSMIAKVLQDASVADYKFHIANTVGEDTGLFPSGGFKVTKAVQVRGLFAAMLFVAGLNPDYDVDDTEIILDSNRPDFKYYNTNFSEDTVDLNKVFLGTQYQIDGNEIGPLGWVLQLTDSPLISMQQLLRALCDQFGVLVRMDYDPSADGGNGRHKIQVIQKGRAYVDSENLSFSGIKTSSIGRSTDLLFDSVRARNKFIDDIFLWRSAKRLGNGDQDFEVDADPPEDLEIENEIITLFRVNGGTDHVAAQDGLMYSLTGDPADIQPVDEIDYYRYDNDTYVTTSAVQAASPNFRCYAEEAATGYRFFRNAFNFPKITRTYGGVAADNGSEESFRNLAILRRTSINDLESTRHFYANSVEINIENMETTIEWIEE